MCRKKYSLTKTSEKKFLLSPKDLCLVDKVGQLLEIGVSSLKIEGRNRRAEYVGETVRVYRKVLDGLAINKNDRDRLKIAFNRGDYTEG